MTSPSRLSDQQLQAAMQKAIEFRLQVTAIALAHEKGKAKGEGQGQGNFFPELFRIAADLIEKDADDFCDRAEEVFEEIEAYEREPDLDDDWLMELTGERDAFYFRADSLVTALPPLPGKKRGRKPKPPTENEVVQAVQNAVQQAEDALSVAHMEDPKDWIQRIQKALQENHGSADFHQLLIGTRLSPGALFLGLLLGHEYWGLGQTEFYGTVVVVLRTDEA